MWIPCSDEIETKAMAILKSEKLRIKFIHGSNPDGPFWPRKYTLTHSDISGELFLSIGTDYDHAAVSGFYTRIMRDEVLAEFLKSKNEPEFHVYCHVSGGFVIGNAKWRYSIFQQHLRLVLQAFRYGDDIFLTANPEFENATVFIQFQSSNHRYNLIEQWGTLFEYRITEANHYAKT
jgi:hypothetical protein